jgi:hypothetical protein
MPQTRESSLNLPADKSECLLSKSNRCPLNGSRRSTSCTYRANYGKPLLMSV